MVAQSERIYSSAQLVQAMRSGITGIREQLSVLNVLDGTASGWPGITQAVTDVDFLVDMAAAQSLEMEEKVYRAECRAMDAEKEVVTLRGSMGLANQALEGLRKELAGEKRGNSQLSCKLDQAKAEAIKHKQELWALEKQRADLASEAEKYKQDNEYLEVEVRTLRSTNIEQASSLSGLKEEVSARNADVLHLKQQTIEQRRELEALRKKLESTISELRGVHGSLEGMRTEKNKFEQETMRLKESIKQVQAELSAANAENQRRHDLDTLHSMVFAEKTKEEQASIARSHQESMARAANLDKRLAVVSAELANTEARLKAKSSEAAGLSKQVQLLGINNKELTKQVGELTSAKQALERSVEGMKAQVAEYQAQVQAAQVQAVNSDKERSLTESRLREAWASERVRLQAAAEECKRESVVQRTLADSASRDLKELQARLKAESDALLDVRSQLNALSKTEDSKKYETFMAGTLADAMVKDLKAQVAAKETELKRQRADAMSMQRRLEKQIESLQRECNESAAEVQRLRRGDGLPLLAQPRTLHDDLTSLKRLVSSMPGPDHLPSEQPYWGAHGGPQGGAHGGSLSYGGSFPRLPPAARLSGTLSGQMGSGNINGQIGSRQRSS